MPCTHKGLWWEMCRLWPNLIENHAIYHTHQGLEVGIQPRRPCIKLASPMPYTHKANGTLQHTSSGLWQKVCSVMCGSV